MHRYKKNVRQKCDKNIGHILVSRVFIINGLTDKTTLGSKPKNVILKQVSWSATDGLFMGAEPRKIRAPVIHVDRLIRTMPRLSRAS